MLELLILGGLGALAAKAMSSSNSDSSSSSDDSFTQRIGDYEFLHREVDGEWRAYIRRQPDYGDRPEDLHSTHRYHDGDQHYVCWSEPVESREDSEAIARLWA